MKQLIAFALCILMLVTLIACGEPAETTPADTQPETTAPETPVVPENVIAPEVEEGTWGAAFWEVFQGAVAEGATAESVINALYASEAGKGVNNAMVAPVMEGYLPGFSADITGFKSGATLASMMMGVPFAAYVFELEADANVREFVKLLKDNSDPAWNICTTAEQTTIGAINNFAILVHCDLQMPAGVGAAEIIAPEVTAGSKAEMLWNDFVLYMDAQGAFALATDVADYLAMNEAFGENMPSTEALGESIEIEGMKYAIEGHNNAALLKAGEISVYMIQIDPGMEAWADYYISGNIADGAQIISGSHGTTFLLMLGTEA